MGYTVYIYRFPAVYGCFQSFRTGNLVSKIWKHVLEIIMLLVSIAGDMTSWFSFHSFFSLRSGNMVSMSHFQILQYGFVFYVSVLTVWLDFKSFRSGRRE